MPHQLLLRSYWENRTHLTIVDDLLRYDVRTVIPRSMPLQILVCNHTCHLGLTSVHPGHGLPYGGRDSPHKSVDHPMPHLCQGPTNASVLPSSPLERVATDLYYFLGRKHIIVADYYSRWFDIKELSDKTSHSVINALTEVFATHGIPDEQIDHVAHTFCSLKFDS